MYEVVAAEVSSWPAVVQNTISYIHSPIVIYLAIGLLW